MHKSGPKVNRLTFGPFTFLSLAVVVPRLHIRADEAGPMTAANREGGAPKVNWLTFGPSVVNK
jgi:hypothetical protein